MASAEQQTEPVTIYGLVDPARPFVVRYVGKTISRLLHKRRLQHLKDKRRKTPRMCWIQHLLSEGRKPDLLVIDICTVENWAEREKFWIAHYRDAQGRELLNVADGGDTGPSRKGCKMSAESRRKISEAAKRPRVSQEVLKKRLLKQQELVESRKLSGYRWWEMGVKAARAFNLGKKHSAERLEKMSASQRGKKRPDVTPWNRKPIICVTTGEVFPSICAARRRFDIGRTNISQVLNGRAKTAGGMKWSIKEVSSGVNA